MDKKVDPVFTLDFVRPQVGVFDPAERQIGMRCTDTDVYPDHTGIGLGDERFGVILILGKNTGPVTKRLGSDDLQGIVEIPDFHDRDNWAEDFFLGDGAAWGHPFENGLCHEIAFLVFVGQLRISSIQDQGMEKAIS